MAGTSLQVDDDYCKRMGNYVINQGIELDDFFERYITILDSINSNGIMEGNTAEALALYIEYARKLKGAFGQVTETAQRQINNFLSEIDNADQYLF